MSSILFVCLGNICRSPAAEVIFAAQAAVRDVPVTVDSAGTGDWHIGAAPHPSMIRAAAERGYDLAPLKARQVSSEDFGRFDLIVAMDRANLAALEAMRPAGSATPVQLFLAGLPGTESD